VLRHLGARRTPAASSLAPPPIFRRMIYTFKVHAAQEDRDPLETTHCAHGADVLEQAKALIEKHPQCGGVEVLMLGSRLFYIPKQGEGSIAQ
jgi:hypothetical protein